MNKRVTKMFCEKAERNRAAFKQREKADLFIKEYEVPEGGSDEFRPIRSYYCPSCDRWHITHIPLLPEREWVAERDNKVNELQVLVQRLKSEFRQADWRAWEPIVGEGMEKLQSFRERPGFEKLVEGLSTQLEHCSAIITTSRAKEDGSANDDFKKMRKLLEQKAKALDYDGFAQEAEYMVEHFSMIPLQKALSSPNREWLNQFTSCVENEGAMTNIRIVMERADESVADSSVVPFENMYEHVMTLTTCMDWLFVSGLPKNIWDILQGKSKKIANVLEFCYSGIATPEGFSLIEKIRITTAERMLFDAARFEEMGERGKALSIVQYMDGRIGALPLSKQKIELMKSLCEVGEKLV